MTAAQKISGGYRRSPRTEFKAGVKFTDEQKAAQSQMMKDVWASGKRSGGYKLSDATRAKMSAAKKGKKYRLGVKLTEDQKRHLSQIFSGSLHPQYKPDRSSLAARQERNDAAYCAWRSEVLSRDGFACKMLNAECAGKIIAHHIKPWSKYPELRYETKNGISLCKAHHPLKRADEERLAGLFTSLVEV